VSDRKVEMEVRLAAALDRGLPGFRKLRSFARLSAGASQETYRLEIDTDEGERTLALRRNAGGVWHDEVLPGRAGIETEALLMRLAKEAGVPEPEVLAILERDDELGQGFFMEWLEGETLGARIVRSESLANVRPQLARQIGEILARIHAIPIETSGLGEALKPVDPGAFVEQTWAGYKLLATPQPMIDYAARWLLEHLPKDPRTTLVHNDFRNGNLMIDESGVVAVLDWEIAHLGDPMRDLGWICTNSWRFGRGDLPVGGFGSYEDLFAGYESVSGFAVDPQHVLFWEVFGSFWWAVGCLGMAHAFREGPDPSIERAAIGRRTSECQVDCVNLLIPGAVEVIQPASKHSTLDLPRIDELVTGVRDHLRTDVMAATEGRLQFMARVAGNALDIVLRELAVGDEHRRLESERLCSLFDSKADLETLRWKLVESLRDGTMPLDAPGLAEHLRTTVVNQIAIDQPKYSGYKAAIATR
jgi:aminoglycoside phosphotransferase (APT) family kinase protein